MNPTIVHEEITSCDGKNSDKNTTNGGEIGHPLVYIHVKNKEVVHCPYCNRSFVFKDDSN
jgi:uncharacterized Zn-finger protein